MNFLKGDTSAKQKARVDEIIRIVTEVKNHEQRNQLFRKRGQDAQIWLNSLQVAAELPEISTELRSSIFKIMLKLSKHSDVTPECLNIKNVTREGKHPIGGGGFGDVWKGKVRQTIVCLKVVRNFQQGNESNSQDLLKQFKREAIVWKQLESHPNILPFFGMYDWDGAPGKLCLVSPWMEGGNLAHYLNPRPPKMKPVVDHITLVTLAYDVASGLEYLHDRKIVHGDLKGVNILIRTLKPLRACIGDFGLSRVSDDHAISLSTTSQSRVEGTLRWLAPELLLDPSCRLSKESDIYAYGCVCYEIFAREVPFFEEPSEGAVVLAIVDGKHPSRLDRLEDDEWNLMLACWSSPPAARLTALEVLERISGLDSLQSAVRKAQTIVPAPDWDSSTLTDIRKNVKYPSTSALAADLVRQHRDLISQAEEQSKSDNRPPVTLRVHFGQNSSPLPVSPAITHEGLAMELCRHISAVWGVEYDLSNIVIKCEEELYPGRFETLETDRDVRIALRQLKDGVVPIFVSCID
ncbi:hypothetical protein E1B28_000197 [Marasmius oreades]|uniref:Protein kinase domain-containing protein n=1 Tax=Marasmius oreades TaxID=181124 RepID=A0A9P7V0R9_9AGAR|nr:uncharacterized protein E1B28_000197 [Marasmius oreades]KAG7098230.1 hypothetical protein E1B28_000197 [Marasmius oreades]